MNVDMNLVADKLREARGFIAKPGTWAQTATAFGPAWRGAGLSPCNVMDPEARSFCAAGAVMRAFGCKGDAAYSDLRDVGDREGGEYCEAIRHLASVSDDYDPDEGFWDAMETLTAWNDDPEREHGEVLAAYDRAIDFADSDVTREILREVRDKLADPVAWVQYCDLGHEGRYTLSSALDEAVDARLSDTDDWDILARESENLTVPCMDALADIYEKLPGWETEFATMCEFNDYEGHDHATILDVIDKAIDRL